MRLTAAISREGDWFVAQCLEVDVASQGSSFDEARANLVEALTLFFEDSDVEIGEAPVITPIDLRRTTPVDQSGDRPADRASHHFS